MSVFNKMKNASIAIGLLLITTIMNGNCQYLNASEQSKTNTDSKKQVKKDNKKSNNKKGNQKGTEALVNKLFKEFQEIVGKETDKNKLVKFYNSNVSKNDLYKKFGLSKPSKKDKKSFDNYFVDYVSNLLSNDIVTKLANYNIKSVSKENKKGHVSVKLQNTNDNNDIIDMTIMLTKPTKKVKVRRIKDLSIMNGAFSLTNGPKNAVNQYCKNNSKEYGQMSTKEKLEACKEAFTKK